MVASKAERSPKTENKETGKKRTFAFAIGKESLVQKGERRERVGGIEGLEFRVTFGHPDKI